MKKIIFSILLIAACGISVNAAEKTVPRGNECASLSEDGHYSKTNMTVSVYTESGHPKGVFAIYLHNGNRYIQFKPNVWICIQGKSRFSYSGNWYVIR